MIIKYQGIKVYYTSAGIGKPIVFLHGFLETGKIWEPFVDELSLKRQVICIDLPGHGRTGTFGEVHSMELMADVVNAVLEELNVQKTTLVGHSMGGYVSMAFAENYREKISGLVLMNSTPEADSEERKITRDRAINLVKRNKNAYIGMAISNLVSPDNAISFEKEIEELKQEAFRISAKGIVAALHGMKIRTDRTKVLKELTFYKIIISGKNDPILSSESVKIVANLSKCPLILIEGGHLSYMENSYVIREIVHFID